jgi:hypothetical protein
MKADIDHGEVTSNRLEDKFLTCGMSAMPYPARSSRNKSIVWAVIHRRAESHDDVRLCQ